MLFRSPSDDLLAELETIYRDLHAHPELSMQEHRTADIAAGLGLPLVVITFDPHPA